MPAALGNCAHVDDRLDPGFADECGELVRSRSSVSEREQLLRDRAQFGHVQPASLVNAEPLCIAM